MKLRTLSSCLLIASCARTSPPTDPAPIAGDMSAEAHRRAAKIHDEQADDEHGGYDVAAVDWRTRTEPYRPELDGFPSYFYNPTEDHLAHASSHRDHAEAHRQAAQQLEAQSLAACRPFKPQERRQCPLLGAVKRVHDLPRGVRLTIREGIDGAGLLAHMQCHANIGLVEGHARMSACPLYVPGLRFNRASDNVIEITTTDGTAIEVLQTRMRRHAGAATDPTE